MEWKRNLFLSAACGLAFFGLGAAGASNTSFEARLQEADKVRSSQPQRFLELLKQLQEERGKATGVQNQHLRYLEAYELGVYQDRIDEGITVSRTLFDKSPDATIRYRSGSLAANLLAVKRDFAGGLRILDKTLSMRRSVRDRSVRHDGLGAGAILYNEMGQYSIGMRYANEMLADAPGPRIKCGASYVRAQSMLNLGLFKSQNAATDRAEIQSVVDQCSAIGEHIFSGLARFVLASKLTADGDPAAAAKMLDSALPEIEATRYPRVIAIAHSMLGELKLKLGDKRAAEEHAKATIALGEEVKSSASLVSAYRTLYELAAGREGPSVALDLYRRYAEAEMAHQSDVRARELAYEIVRNETQIQTQRLAEAERLNQILRLRQTLERENAQKARLATIFLLIVLAGIVFWAVQIKRHHRQLQQLAQTDSLTGLGNRHFFTQMSEKSLVEAARAGEPAALVMFDLDHFKAINDTYGHGAGDWVLKQVGKTCSAHCRKIDYLGRIGGEEFAVLLRGIDLSGATRIAEDCRVQLAKIDTRECGYAFVVTGSFGVSSTAQSGYDLSRLLSHADQMLYRAKNEGRNRVCAYNADAAIDHRSGKRAPTLSIVNS